MKRITFIIIVLLLATQYAYADVDPAEEAEHWEKVRQMDQLAERFKAETGFAGEINPNGALSHLGGFRGKFSDIPFSASADTTAFRQACDSIIDKLLPYTLATRKQLSKSRITKSSSKFETEYYQSVNGYKVESGGLILIIYDVGRYRFSISNGTVELPDDKVVPIISEEEAIRIANVQYYGKSTIEINPWKVVLAYTNGRIPNNKEYYLCYNLYMGTVVCVDAYTGDIRYTWRSDVLH